MKREYEVVVRLEDGRYAYLEANGKSQWKTKTIAEKHAREYKATHLRDAWVQEA